MADGASTWGVALLHRVVSQEATILRNKTGVNNIDLRFLNAPGGWSIWTRRGSHLFLLRRV